jgi:hypothetical protein
MCSLVTANDTLIVRLHINRNEPYDLGTVFEGYFQCAGSGMTFRVTDALKLDGVFLNKVPYAMRKLAAKDKDQFRQPTGHVFTARDSTRADIHGV